MTATLLSVIRRSMSQHARNPETRPSRMPVSLMHTGIWDPLRMKLLASCWWQKMSPMRYANPAGPCPIQLCSMLAADPSRPTNVP